jgi:hypothetical protein
MAQMTPEVSKLQERALSLSVEEQEALADSLISNLGGKVDEGVQAAWEAEIGNRIADGLGEHQDHHMGGSAPAQFSEVAPCQLSLLPFIRKRPLNMTRHSTGTWSAARMPLSSSMPKRTALWR